MEAQGLQDVVHEKDPTRFRAHAPRSVGEKKLPNPQFSNRNIPKSESSLTYRKQTITSCSNRNKTLLSDLDFSAPNNPATSANVWNPSDPSAPAHLTPLRAQTSIVFSHSLDKSLRGIGGIS
jgi:hypothetical protein